MITITEALAEVKTIKARVGKREAAIGQYLVRDARLLDPLAEEGGSREFIRRERQAIGDLQERVVRIRTLIQRANLETPLTVQGRTRTVSEWLNWRREVSNDQRASLNGLAQTIVRVRQQVGKQGGKTTDDDASLKPGDAIVALSERGLAEEIEALETILGELDGKLSLINATTMIDL